MKKHIDSLCRIIRDHITSPLTSQFRTVKQAVIQAWIHTREWTSQSLNRLHVQALKLHTTIFRKLQGFSRYFSYGIVSIAGSFLAGIWMLPKAQEALRQFQNYHDVFVAAGSLIGTMLALMFSLSIIPVQRAVETYTASISRLYREDTPAQFIFVTLAVFSLLSFMMAVNGGAGFHGATLFPVQIVLLGIALDLLRWHHRRVSQLLEPREAVNRLYQQIARHIDRIQRLVAQAARVQWRAQSPELRASRSPEMMESGIYTLFPDSHTPVNNGTSELAEIALKAIGRGETQTGEVAIAAMMNTARHYLDRRKGNLILIPSAAALFLVAEGDVNMVLTPLYERLMDINRNAVAMKAETTCIHVIRAFGSIASYTVNLKAAAFPAHEAPLTHMPIRYLRKCVELVQRHELDDAALEGSHILLQAAQSAPDNVQILHVHLPAIDGCFEIARTFLTTTTPNKATLVNEFLRDIMTLAHHLVQQRHFMADHVLQYILEKNLELAPCELLHEKALGAPVIIMPLALQYDVTNEYSLSHLVRHAASLIDWSEHRAWAKSYGDFRELNEKIWRHFRDLAEKVDLGQSWLLWDITGTIQHIAQLYLCLLKEPMTNDAHYVDELAAQLRWYLSFFWEAFSKANVVDLTYAKHATEKLGWIGLAFLDAGHQQITDVSANNIVSITKDGCKKIEDLSAYQIADLLMPIWHMRVLAEAKQDVPMVSMLDSKLVKPETMTDALWREAQQALEDSKDELEIELSDDYYNLGMYDKNKNLLKNLLQKYWHEADNSGNS